MCTSSSFQSTSLNQEFHTYESELSSLSSKSPSSNTPMFMRGRPNEPQCFHCGWRGGHAPGCPFKSHFQCHSLSPHPFFSFKFVIIDFY
ncbi:uncharacterized protein BT62DRAFT_1012026 [Guyanagaster necrorhizus]|uniref:Uncharacterized protein n=1 Tax=Guyanagaster necrorhizus TaxID=856835 RepID=A0A9P7VJB2_9AGAR|nr:uncharacterized protein BT62DRAFT_1012026 [Guyanagaster necrorhizus MCA 3950]KAG7440999.1 hypothetical protein BT62DRAFT_1012026 [Guyanagaster necrorhizus MCA 3950]